MTEYQKNNPAHNSDELLMILKKRGLNIAEEEDLHVKNAIRAIGYYRLSGFFGPLQSSENTFREGATFNDILRLYEFDRRLRKITAHALKVIEIELRARLTDVMSLAHESDWYVRKELFDLTHVKKEMISKCVLVNGEIEHQNMLMQFPKYELLLKDIAKTMEKNEDKEDIIEFKNKYGEHGVIPSWMVMECISLGTLSRLYSLLKITEEKKAVALHFGAVVPDTFTSWLHGFVIIRNACAHHSRIWNKKLTGDLMFPKRKTAMFIDSSVAEKGRLRKFYGISSCILRVLQEISQPKFAAYKTKFYKIVEEHGIDLTAMGFPTEFKEYEIWKN